MHERLVWLGVRESDIINARELFSGSVTIFGSGNDNNVSMDKSLGYRMNHNGDMPEYNEFFEQKIKEILSVYPETRFVQYDAIDGYEFSEQIREHFIYQNDYRILNWLNNKHKTKEYFSELVPVLPYKIIKGKDCDFELLKKYYPDIDSYVFQKTYSWGGSGTFLINDKNLEEVTILDDDECYLVSPYIENGVSVNIHCIIYKNDILFFAPSMQLISHDNNMLEYIGSDYSAYSLISTDNNDKVLECSKIICKSLQGKGYRGVCGIDYLLYGDTCYFMEVNPRFQASTALLNKNLIEQGYSTIFDYHIDSFINDRANLDQPGNVADGSFLIYYYNEKQKDRLRWLYRTINETENFNIIDDNLNWNSNIEDGSYVFQLHSSQHISWLDYYNKIRIQPNALISLLDILEEDEYTRLLHLKVLLLTRGVYITPEVWVVTSKADGIDWEEFYAVTIRLPHNIWITASICDSWYDISPVRIEWDDNTDNYYISFYGDKIINVDILPRDKHEMMVTSNGHLYKDIVYKNPDRLRIYHRDGCIFQDNKTGCRFCDLFGTGKKIEFSEIKEVLASYWEDKDIRHYLIGGGSDLPEREYKRVVELSSYISDKDGKPIYLMAQPIKNKEWLVKLKECGVSEIAFNIEIFDRKIAAVVEPGKSGYSLEEYYESLKMAVDIFGDKGEVRSAILLGFDDIDTFKLGIEQLCKLRVSPILSVFRPCEDTPLYNSVSYNELETLYYYNVAKEICKKYAVQLGPSCKACQNNVVALDYN